MNDNKKLIIKFSHTLVCNDSLEELKIRKINSSISPLQFIHLLHYADNKVNPRTATVNPIVKSIELTLRDSPELFFFKTKGILISTMSCTLLDRNRVRLTFDDLDTEGIMDGGHNAFAIARFIIERLYDGEMKAFKDWDSCKAFWTKETSYNDILNRYEEYPDKSAFRFSIPIEIITPIDPSENLEDFYNNISEICSARNANVQLTEAARSNQRGCYDYLKNGPLKNYPIIWKNGSDGNIKVDDIIALACIPLIKLNNEGYFEQKGIDVGSLNKISIYSQKSKCVSFYRKVMENEHVSTTNKGKFVLNDTVIQSSLDLLEDIIKFCDVMYYQFPRIYNANNGSFGRITGVLSKQSQGPFSTYQKIQFKYAYGFFYPIICGLTELMEYKFGKLSWIINPLNINWDDSNVKNKFSQYMSIIRLLQYNPNKVGKETAVYTEADNLMRSLLQ